MHPFSPFRSPIFAHPSPPHIRSRTPSYTLFTLFNVPASVFLLPVKRKASACTWPFFSIFNDFSDPCSQRKPIPAGAADRFAACGALQGGLPWEPVQRGIEKAPSRSDLTLPFDSRFVARSARFGRTTCAAAVREEHKHRCYALVWLMTSSTKLSSRFWSPSPISNRAKLSTLNRPPIICLTETS